ncbi:uncharacterized protein LOC121379764 [Gigantopelta aegis]|uniref:uncharacterized protein LOC121379764 n=1 Tax=Gigantopelta aegis TaxID=1735272 RepID=UPI001B88B84A|nr:uncharacterized protein LOC121379764 [Gigantopelta aegis]
MEKDVSSKEQDPGELLEQLSQMKNELARKQRKLKEKKCRRSEKVKAHVKQKLQEQAQLYGEHMSQNDLNRSTLPSPDVSNSSALTLNPSGEDICSHIHSTEGRDITLLSPRENGNTEGTCRLQDVMCLTKQKSVVSIEDDERSGKNETNTCELKSGRTEEISSSHSKCESNSVVSVKANKNKLASRVKESLFKLNLDSKHSQCYSEAETCKNLANKVKLKSDCVSVAKDQNQDYSGCRTTNVLSFASNNSCILKSPTFTFDNTANISPDILSGESRNEKFCHLRDNLKIDDRFLADSLAVTPSFVSGKALSDGHSAIQESSMKPWQFDSELTDIKLNLDFDSETQLADDLSIKYHISRPRNNVAVKDSKNVPSSKELETKSALCHFTDVQNDDKMTGTSALFFDSETNESENICAKRQLWDQGRSCSILSGCTSSLKQHEKEGVTGKRCVQKDLHGSRATPQTKVTSSPHSNSNNLETKSGRCFEMDSEKSSFSGHCRLNMDKSQHIKNPSFQHKSDGLKIQTSSLPSIVRSFTANVGRNLSTRKRHRSNSFSDFSSRKKFKDLDDFTMKSYSNKKSSDTNESRNMQHVFMEKTDKCLGGSNNICDVNSPKTENCVPACDKKCTETQANVLGFASAEINLHSSIVINNSNSMVDMNTDSVKVSRPNSTQVGNAKEADLTSETPDSDTSDSNLSQSLLKPVLPLKNNDTGNQNRSIRAFDEPVSASLNQNGKISGLDDNERTCVGEIAGSVYTQTMDVTSCLGNEKTQKPYCAERGPCSQSEISIPIQAKSPYNEESVGSSDESVKIVEEINSVHKNKRDDIGENYLDFTELDAIPFSQMELSESFLSDPEAYQTERMKGSSRGRNRQYGIFVQRKSPRLTSGICSILDGHVSQSHSSVSSYLSSQSLSSHSEQRVSSIACRSRKSLMISSLFQFLVDEAKRKKSEEEFYLPETQYGCLVAAKCSETQQTEASGSVLKHLTDTQSLNHLHECSEELYSQDYLNDHQHPISDVCKIDACIDADLPGATIVNQSIQLDVFETKHGIVKQGPTDALSSKLSSCIKQDVCQVHVFQRENPCSRESMSSHSNVHHSWNDFHKTSMEPYPSPCSTMTAITVSAVSSTVQKVESDDTNNTTCLPLMNSEVCLLSPDRGSVHGDACLPTDCASSQSSVETECSSETFSETPSTVITGNATKHLQKGGLRYLSCFQTGKDEPVLSLTAGSVMSNNEVVQFVACMSEYSLSLWSSDGPSGWTNELDWLLPVACCAKNMWLLPHQTKVALLISGIKDEVVSWLLLFVYHWQTGESSRLNLDLPVTDLTSSRNNLLCCPLMDNQVILCCNQSSTTLVQKYSLADSLDEITSRQCLEGTTEKLLSLSVVEDLNLALVGLSSDSRILVWNHHVGTLLTQIDVGLILPCSASLACVLSVKGYLLLVVMNRSSEDPGCFLAVNPQIEMSKLFFHFDKCKGGIQSFKHSVVSKKIIAAIDEDGDIVMWDKYYGNILAHLPQSHSTSLHLSNSLLFAGQENGCVHVMEIR